MTAYATSVGEVRQRYVDTRRTPATGPWAGVSADTPAAWCELRTYTGAEVRAAIYGQAGLLMATSSEPILGTDGPRLS